MSFLFGKGDLKSRMQFAFKMALAHGKILALFAFVYKSTQCILANLRGKSDPFHSFIGGLAGSYCLLKFKTEKSINRQIGYYLIARVIEGIFLKLIKEGYLPD